MKLILYIPCFIIDCSKVDKNSNNFDIEYYNKIVNERPINPNVLHILIPTSKIEKYIKELKPFFSLDYTPFLRLEFTNYDYLEKINDVIEKGLEELESKYGEVKIEFSIEHNPKLKLGFNGKKIMFMSSYDFKNEFLEDLNNKILELFNKKIDFDSYIVYGRTSV